MPTNDHPTLAIIGGGQLGRMLALAAIPLGINPRVLDPAGKDCSAAPIAALTQGSFDDLHAIEQLVANLTSKDAVTFEFENVPAHTIAWLEQEAATKRFAVHPAARSLQVAQDRAAEKQLFEQLNIPVGPYRLVNSQQQLKEAWHSIGQPAQGLVIKARAGGYDGKSQATLRSEQDIQSAWDSLHNAATHIGLIAEAFVPFSQERSVIITRAASGETRTYPNAINTHTQGILTQSTPTTDRSNSAESAAIAIANNLKHVGTLAVEFFELQDGSVLANELAPRVHNSAHWSIEACHCSQFENHARAVLNLPLGDTSLIQPTTMLNIIGQTPSPDRITAIPGAHLHLYNKQPRPNRKTGHITISAPDQRSLNERTEQAQQILDSRDT